MDTLFKIKNEQHQKLKLYFYQIGVFAEKPVLFNPKMGQLKEKKHEWRKNA